MTPKELYPIGTQLITRRLSQATLGSELFGKFAVDSWLQEQDTGNVSKWNKGFCSAERCHVLGNTLLKPVCEWRVTVTAENQKWLSPVPMVGDKIQYHQDPHGSMYVSNIVSFINDDILDLKADPSTDAETYETEISIYQVHDILKRTYPNGQRAPLIEFDEVILPTKGELS